MSQANRPVYCDHQVMHSCCGVQEPGGFTFKAPHYHGDPLDAMKEPGIGYFVCTFVKGDPACTAALRQLRKDHRLVFQTKYITNNSYYAGEDEHGNKNRVKLCVFQYGK